MALIKEMYQTTYKLREQLKQPYPLSDDDRDGYIARVNELLELRQRYLDQGAAPETEMEQKAAREVLEMNKDVQQMLAERQQMIQQDLNKLKKKRQTGRRYENPYAGPSPDGMFFDSKK
ncbi:flagellar protein FliT [Alkalicoccus chagannorensis]|uniref:flagellar protein FliT n=1 Tax=Alkalicoccus chagannorensis TaxID=427072 RepID=UPI000404D4F6|nr:flagellar protein FliT [Alkalicoccus chagannorensis]